MPSEQTTPLVSICCLAFNQKEYIGKAIDSMLMQQTSFTTEIIIHDDASTDGTDQIIKQYAELHPNQITAFFESNNQYTSGYNGRMALTFLYPHAKGKYIAYCEGDDYWTDPLKLQKQVDFMESHPDYSVCFHRWSNLNMVNGTTSPDICQGLIPEGQDGIDINLDMFFDKWITQPLTMLMRKSMFNFEWHKKYKFYRDSHEIYHLLLAGRGRLMQFNGGVYRIHPKGIASLNSPQQYCENYLPLDREFYKITRIPQARRIYCQTLQECSNVYTPSSKTKAFNFAFEQFLLNHNYKTFIKNIKRILNYHNNNNTTPSEK